MKPKDIFLLSVVSWANLLFYIRDLSACPFLEPMQQYSGEEQDKKAVGSGFSLKNGNSIIPE